MHYLQRMLVTVLACMVATSATAVTDKEIQEAIKRIKTHMFETQEDDGSWETGKGHGGGREIGGETSIITYALLASGESPQRPEIKKAIDYLASLPLQPALGKDKPEKDAQGNPMMRGVYSIGLRCHVWSQLPGSMIGLEGEGDWDSLLGYDVRWLDDARYRETAMWDYSSARGDRNGRSDHSISQYGLLGIWEGAKRGLHLSGGFWETSYKSWLDGQNKDGGWAYMGRGGNKKKAHHTKSYGSMTAAGLTAAYVIQQELFRERMTPEPKIDKAIEDGIAWFQKNFDGADNPGRGGSHRLYYLYGVERVALAGGYRYFNGQDWYTAGASYIVKNRGRGGGNRTANHDDAFALLFLVRGRVPIWCNKLAIDGANWKNRPNDIYFLNDYLSDFREGELNWQVINLKRPVKDLLSAPLLYLSGSGSVDFSDEQVAKIKTYLDEGGLLWCNPDTGSAAFKGSIEGLCRRMYPNLNLRRLPDAHPLFSALHNIPRGSRQGIMGLSNGARDLVYVAGQDYGYEWQSDRSQSGAAWQIAANLFTLGTDRGNLPSRMDPRWEKQTGTASATVNVGRAQYNSENWLPEAGWHMPLNRRLANTAGVKIDVTPGVGEDGALKLADIGNFEGKLATIQGVNEVELKPEEIEAIQQYVARGGTVLVETVGGRGRFAISIEEQLAKVLGTRAAPLGGDDAIISGAGLEGGQDARTVDYRRFAVLTMNVRHRPRVAAFYINSRPSIIVSQEDLTLGVIGVNQWGIIGYTPESARRLMNNIVLYAKSQTLGGE